MGNQDHEADFQGCRKRTSKEVRTKWRKMKLSTMAEKNAEKVWKTMTSTSCNGDVLVMMALRSILRWRTTTWWPNRNSWCRGLIP